MWIGFYNKVNLLFLLKIFKEVFFIKQELLINGQIRANEVEVIDDNGDKLGVMPLEKALDLAGSKELDLVLVAPNNEPKLCKLMNYGKYKFEQAKKEKEAKKKQKVTEIKEIRITPNTDTHDIEFKTKNARKFLEEGNKVRITVKFRGREMSYTKLGEETMNQIITGLEDIASVEKAPKMEGRNMFAIVAPKTADKK